jgi:hypothetical protein
MGCRRYTLTQLDMGSLMRPAGIPIESKLYLIRSVITGQDQFRYSGVAGLGAPVRSCVSQRDGEDTSIDIDRPTSFHSQFPELNASAVPAERTRACSHCWRRSPESVGRTCSVQDCDNLHSTPGGVAYAA